MLGLSIPLAALHVGIENIRTNMSMNIKNSMRLRRVNLIFLLAVRIKKVVILDGR